MKKSYKYSFYLVPKSFLKTVDSIFGKNNLFIRDMFNYRNLEKNSMYDFFKLNSPIKKIYSDFPEDVVDDYISYIGKDKIKPCLLTESYNFETLFDENDYIMEGKDLYDFWNSESSLPELKNFHYRDFERYIMEIFECVDNDFSDCVYIIRKEEDEEN